MALSAMGPTNESAFLRRIPPGTMTRMFLQSANCCAIFNALVMTVNSWKSHKFLAISIVVVPESRMMVSPFWISSAACRPMACFCLKFFLAFSFNLKSMPTRCGRMAPPLVRISMFFCSSCAKSLRMVTGLTLNILLKVRT